MTLGALLLLSLSLLSATRSSAAALSHRSPSDTRLEDLVQRFAHEHDRKAEAELQRVGLSRIAPRLARLWQTTPRNWDLSFDLAFTLAYLGVDYRQNVRRLVALDELWDRGDPRWRKYVNDVSDMRDEIPDMVVALYRHNHDPALLRTLFSWRLDGDPAEELASDHVRLLTDYPLQALRILQGSPTREENAIGSLSDGVGADDAEYRRAIRSIRRSSRQVGPALRRYVRRFLERAGWRWKISQEEKNLRGADLSHMTGLSGMDLHGLDLRGADLRNANLENTDLRGSKLRGAHLLGARYNRRTQWPAGFDPRRHGAVLVR